MSFALVIMCLVNEMGQFMNNRHIKTKFSTGLTLLEVTISLTVIAVGLMGILSALTSISTLADANHDQLLAINVARQKLAELQSAPFSSAFSQYGPGSNGSSFSIAQLQNGIGSVIFPVNAAGKLDETIVDSNLGMPQDLNGNGTHADTDVSSTYTVLPVRIHLQWTSPTGKRELDLNTLLTKLN